MKTLQNVSLAVLIGAGALALTVPAASARVVCNDEGDCWHERTELAYPTGVHVEVHPDTWKWGETEHRAWREHEGRGYWHNHSWVDF